MNVSVARKVLVLARRLHLLSSEEKAQLTFQFKAGIEDFEWKVIPTAWVEKAMEAVMFMDSVSVDVARGRKRPDGDFLYVVVCSPFIERGKQIPFCGT